MTRASLTTARRFGLIGLLILVAVVMSACEWSELLDGDEDSDENDATPPAAETNIPGLSLAVSTRGFDATRSALLDAIAERANLSARTEVDHQANARNANLSLRPTTVLFVADANRESALIAADARVALDLPARVLVYRDRDNDIGVAFSNAAYLAARYDLDGVENGTLDALDDDLEAVVRAAANADLDANAGAAGIAEGEGIESVTSRDDFTTVVNRLNSAIQSREALTPVDTIDFASRSLGRDVGPSTLFIFGNPNAGTPLMRSNQTIGIDLPQKMLVAQADDGTVTVYYNRPAFIAARHDIDDRDDRIDAIADLLAQIAGEAAGTSAGTNESAGDANTPAGGTTQLGDASVARPANDLSATEDGA
ncbi:DUF302 domain-containing protein [uncultured Salinisphaera sp.]|uniref:DUF302 domain-containing protein n=1 Tax=uncultured Salinisphaera sp. TaxID=359372 RepID=UPI0032B23A1E